MSELKLELESRHSDWGEDAGGYSVLRFNGEWVGRVEDRALAEKMIQAVAALETRYEQGVVKPLRDQLDQLQKTRFLSESGKTHWEGCWRDHYRCAMTRIEEQAAEIKILKAQTKEGRK